MLSVIIIDTCKLRDNNIKSKVSTSAQIIYHCSILPVSVLGIAIYIFSTGKSYGNILAEILIDMYTYDKNHSYALVGVSQVINK
jgi:hypothetical protein